VISPTTEAADVHTRVGVYVDGFTLLCRRRHKSVYADLLVMPMPGVLSQVRVAGLFRNSAYS
jgi:hypothetical protein